MPQRRLFVHIQRECLLWLTHKPRSEAGRELRRIVCGLNTITDREQWGNWIVELVRWGSGIGNLNQKTVPDDDPKRRSSLTKWLCKSFVHSTRLPKRCLSVNINKLRGRKAWGCLCRTKQAQTQTQTQTTFSNYPIWHSLYKFQDTAYLSSVSLIYCINISHTYYQINT